MKYEKAARYMRYDDIRSANSNHLHTTMYDKSKALHSTMHTSKIGILFTKQRRGKDGTFMYSTSSYIVLNSPVIGRVPTIISRGLLRLFVICSAAINLISIYLLNDVSEN